MHKIHRLFYSGQTGPLALGITIQKTKSISLESNGPKAFNIALTYASYIS